MTEAKNIKRCAIYTRKSNEEGLELAYNSLDAQRESAENFIKSQNGSGWIALPEHYDDGGFTGGNMDRPALKQLLTDIENGKIDCVVTYKIDRLSRSLIDFTKIMEVFNKYGVNFVSVTQQFSTIDSAGRMMLNILITFSQYEREIISDRIRDKIAGTKRRGKYCGGPPVLGYDVDSENKKLVINQDEAVVVREAFRLYAQYGSATETARRLNALGYRTKTWTSRKNIAHDGEKFAVDRIYRMLNNPLYVGEVYHKGQSFPGEHEAIIERGLWDAVQKVLKDNTPVAAGYRKNAIGSPFKGLLRCGHCGGAFGITYGKNNKKNSDNRRYMYYLCIKDEDRVERRCPLARIPAGDIDRVILEQISRIFKAPSVLAKVYGELRQDEAQQRKVIKQQQDVLEAKQETIRKQLLDGGDQAQLRPQFAEIEAQITRIKEQSKEFCPELALKNLLKTCDSIESIWEELFPVERYRLAHLLFDRIQIFTDHLVMDVKTDGLKSLVKELGADESVTVTKSEEGNGQIVRLTVPLVIRRRHGRKVVLGPENAEPVAVAPEVVERGLSAIALHLARGYAWMEMIESGKVASIAELAKQLNIDKNCVTRDLRLISLAPDLQKLAAEGSEPETLSLARLREPFPEDWEEQRRRFLANTAS